MLIKDLTFKGKPGYGAILVVYGIYWFSDELYFYCSPKKFDGIMSYRESDIEIIKPELGDDFFLGNLIMAAALLLKRYC